MHRRVTGEIAGREVLCGSRLAVNFRVKLFGCPELKNMLFDMSTSTVTHSTPKSNASRKTFR